MAAGRGKYHTTYLIKKLKRIRLRCIRCYEGEDAMKHIVITVFTIIFTLTTQAQAGKWQQHISYNINAHLDVKPNKLTGSQRITYTNNSPDTLRSVFFHTYWNAFQPGSSMDVRSRELGQLRIGTDRQGNPVYDRYKRVYDRISKLSPEETGYQQLTSATAYGKKLLVKDHETIAEVVLEKPLLPKSSLVLDVVFEAQVPKIIRRSGRDSDEGIRYSMGQWYPRMAEYDERGWNANQYVAFEFYGVFGNYDVKLTLDKSYMVGATGVLQNPQQVGFGYQAANTKVIPPKGNTLTWHFVANNVHDFVWAADPDYIKITRQIPGGPLLHVIYDKADTANNAWEKVADTAVLAYPLMARLFGQYPYKVFSIIQGGDGGMEYPMATLMRTPSPPTAIHEWLHSWYQGVVATNETLYPWMDEGFSNYAESRVMHLLRGSTGFAQEDNYRSYFSIVRSGLEEPASTPADFFSVNYASAISAYYKGSTFISQLGYIVGDSVLDKILLNYYNTWKFKHPTPNDFMRVAEKTSGLTLQWYKDYWINTTKTIDYAIDSLWEEGGKTKVRIRKMQEIPMPVDVQLTFKNGTTEMHLVPLNLMFGVKAAEDNTPTFTHTAWKWTHPTYTLEISRRLFDLKEVHIDPSQRMADIERRNNVLKLNW